MTKKTKNWIRLYRGEILFVHNFEKKNIFFLFWNFEQIRTFLYYNYIDINNNDTEALLRIVFLSNALITFNQIQYKYTIKSKVQRDDEPTTITTDQLHPADPVVFLILKYIYIIYFHFVILICLLYIIIM